MSSGYVCFVCGSLSAGAAESVVYPGCGVAAVKVIFKTIDICPVCQAGTASPRFADGDIDALYAQGDYWKDKILKTFRPREYPGAYANACARARFYASCPGSAKELSVLDIGAGQGMFGVALVNDTAVKLKQYHVIESDQFCCRSLEQTWKTCFPAVEFAVVDGFEKIQQTYNLIVLSHILEHVNDPVGMLESLEPHLAPGGCILVDVPHLDHLYKPDVFPHISFFSLNSLKIALKRAGFSVQECLAFGRSRNSARDLQNPFACQKLVEKAVYKSRMFLPQKVSVGFYNWLWQPSRGNDQGIWLRAIARKELLA
jgi:SAM-dependent methyltransferase